MASNNKVTGWVGWVFFAGFVMILLGIFQAIYGLVAIFNSNWFAVTGQGLLFVDLTAWGWVHLLVGIVVFLAGFGVLYGGLWGRLLGVLLAVASLFTALFSVNLHPIWSVIIMVVDVLVIYALTVHGDEAKKLS